MKLKEKTMATLLIAIFMISIFAVGVQAMHFLGMNGGSLSVTSVFGTEPKDTVLGDVVFDAQSGLVTIEGTISDLNVDYGGWPDTAYIEIGIRPEAAKEETNAGVYMIGFESSAPGTLVFHMQDYSGHRPGGHQTGPCVYIDAELANLGIRYKITLTPSGDFGGTAFFEIWDADDTYYDEGLPPAQYGYSIGDPLPAQLDEDFSEARLFYSLMAEGLGVSGITYSATIGDITTNIPGPHPTTWYIPTDFATIQDAIDSTLVEDGDTILVAAGTYAENLVIDKSLTVKSIDGAAVTIIHAQPTDFGVFIIGETTIATFEGFTVENYAIAGILAGSFGEAEADPLEVYILNNIVSEPVSDEHNNNIQIGDGTTGTVIGNEVFGAFLTSPDWSGSGILVAGSSGVLISNNYVHDCEGGIQTVGYEDYRDAPAVGNIIENNRVENCETGISPQGYSIGTIIRYNDVSNNDVGIGCLAYDFSWEQSSPSGTEVHYNNIVGNEYGAKSSVWWHHTGDVLAEQVDATLNWWGAVRGPSRSDGDAFGHEAVKGDRVRSNVRFAPWLKEAVDLE